MSKPDDRDFFNAISDAILAGDAEEATKKVEEALEAGVEAMALIHDGVIAGTDQLGDKFQKLEIYLPELVQGGEAAKSVMDLLLPHLDADEMDQARTARVVLGTVSGDVHDIGKNLVAAMLGASGFEVIDLGVDVAPRDFVAKAEEVGAEIIALSALMTNSLPFQKDVIDYLVDGDLRDRYYVIVGGGPVTPEWAQEIGADGCGRHASDASDLCKQLMAARLQPPLSEPVTVW